MKGLKVYTNRHIQTSKIWHSTFCHFLGLFKVASYSLLSIKQNYNFDMLAMIWHEIVCWFLKIYQDLKSFAAQEHRIVFVLTFRCAEQFYVPNMQKQSKTGKNPEINRQSFVISWLNSRKYISVWYLLSCTTVQPVTPADQWKHLKISKKCLIFKFWI